MPVPPYLHARVSVLLLFSPPTLGAILGGALVRLIDIARDDAWASPPDVGISIGMAAVSALLLSALLVRAFFVYDGATTEFPRLFRALPLTALAGFALGLGAALANAR